MSPAGRRPVPSIALRRRPGRRRPWAAIYLAALALVPALAAIALAPSLRRPTVADALVFAVFALVAALSRQHRVLGWRIEADAVTPAFVFAALVLAGPLVASAVVVVAYGGEVWRGEGKRHRVQAALVQLGAVTVGATALHQMQPSAHLAAASPTAFATAVVYWAAWQVLALPLPLVSGRPISAIGLGVREEALRAFLLLLAGVTLAVLWGSGPLAFGCGLITLTFLNRAVASSHFGRETLLEPKTGLFNARYFQEVTESELQRCKRLDRPASVLMADLDHLREINNRYGHQTGDMVIRRVAEVIKEGTRTFDVPSRFGGEEFAILLPETSKRRGRVIAERLRQALAAEDLHAVRPGGRRTSDSFRVTVSIGVATFPEDADSADALIARADEAAYQAKAAGRNRVKVHNYPAELEELLAAKR